MRPVRGSSIEASEKAASVVGGTDTDGGPQGREEARGRGEQGHVAFGAPGHGVGCCRRGGVRCTARRQGAERARVGACERLVPVWPCALMSHLALVFRARCACVGTEEQGNCLSCALASAPPRCAHGPHARRSLLPRAEESAARARMQGSVAAVPGRPPALSPGALCRGAPVLGLRRELSSMRRMLPSKRRARPCPSSTGTGWTVSVSEGRSRGCSSAKLMPA